MFRNHASDIPPPLLYAIDEKQATGPPHAQGEGIAWRHEQEAEAMGGLPLVCFTTYIRTVEGCIIFELGINGIFL